MCCGKPASEVGPISWRGNCVRCAEQLVAENIVGIAEKRGYPFRRRLNGMERYIEQARQSVQEPV